MSDAFEVGIPLFIFCGAVAVVFGIMFAFAAYVRNLRHKEIVKMAEQGLVKAPEVGNGKDTLRWGIVITALGIALTLGLFPIGANFPLYLGPWMIIGLLPTFFGLALIIIYKYTRNGGGKNEE